MEMQEDTQSYYSTGFLVLLGFLLCAKYFRFWYEGLSLGIGFLLFLVILDKTTTKESKKYTEKQKEFIKKSNLLIGSLFLLT